MASDISSGGSSDFLSARQYFYPTGQREEVVEVFVEDQSDTVFWRQYFTQYDSSKVYKIKVLRNEYQELSGKDSLFTYIPIDTLGQNKLIAIDADYDYIIDNYHNYTSSIRECKYVLYTCDAYSKENIKMYPSMLLKTIYDVCLCEHVSENIDEVLEQISCLYYDLFTIHLYSMWKRDSYYSLQKFKNDLSKLSFNVDRISCPTINYITGQKERYQEYLSNNDIEYKSFLSELNRVGISNKNCWQFFNGHNTLSEVGVKIVKSISNKYRSAYFLKLRNLYSDSEKLQQAINKYKNQTCNNCPNGVRERIEQLLSDNTIDMSVPSSIKILSNISRIYNP